MVTEESVADVLRDLVARLARVGEVAQLAVQHSLELKPTIHTMFNCVLGTLAELVIQTHCTDVR